jgi:hypothetical protein
MIPVVNYSASKNVPDTQTHGFGWQFHYDALIKNQMSEFNNAYLSLAVLRVTLWVTIQLKSFQIKDKHDSKIDNFYPRPPDMSYLWHYCYEANEIASKICCDQDFVDKHCLQYIRRFPRNNIIKHKIVWNLKPKN